MHRFIFTTLFLGVLAMAVASPALAAENAPPETCAAALASTLPTANGDPVVGAREFFRRRGEGDDVGAIFADWLGDHFGNVPYRDDAARSLRGQQLSPRDARNAERFWGLSGIFPVRTDGLMLSIRALSADGWPVIGVRRSYFYEEDGADAAWLTDVAIVDGRLTPARPSLRNDELRLLRAVFGPTEPAPDTPPSIVVGARHRRIRTLHLETHTVPPDRDADAIQQQFADIVASLPALRELSLRADASEDTLDLLEVAAAAATTLTTFKLHAPVGDDEAEAAVAAIVAPLRNLFTQELVTLFRRWSQLENLTIDSVPLTPRVLGAIAPTLRSLTMVGLFRPMRAGALGTALARWPQLERLTIEQQQGVDGIRSCANLRALTLTGVTWRAADAAHLRRLESLRSLELESVGLPPERVLPFVPPTLHELTLVSFRSTVPYDALLGETLARLTELDSLFVRDIFLRGSFLTSAPASLAALHVRLGPMAARHLRDYLERCTRLKDLSVYTAMHFGSAYSVLPTTLERLALNGHSNLPPLPVDSALIEGLQRTPNLHTLDLVQFRGSPGPILAAAPNGLREFRFLRVEQGEDQAPPTILHRAVASHLNLKTLVLPGPLWTERMFEALPPSIVQIFSLTGDPNGHAMPTSEAAALWQRIGPQLPDLRFVRVPPIAGHDTVSAVRQHLRPEARVVTF